MRRNFSFDKYSHYRHNDLTGTPLPNRDVTDFSVFFNDGTRKIDYVLVYCKDEIDSDTSKSEMLATYIKNIKLSGLKVEEETGTILDALICVKIHAPKTVLNKYVDSFKMELNMNDPNYKFHIGKSLKCVRSIVTHPDENSPVTRRAPDILSGKQPTDFTDAERIYIVQKILSQVKYSDENEDDTGFDWLVSEKVLVAAYALHDSSEKWTTDGPLTNRQILARYWACVRCFYKEQPLTLIERYYGPAVAFYFAWVEYYTQMLVPAAIIGFICFVCGIVYFYFDNDYMREEVCNSDHILCPIYIRDKYFAFEPLKNSCTMITLAYVIDNPITIIYSILMCFWGVTFVALWKRKQANLNLRWNLHEEILDTDIRSNFKKKAQVQRISSITGHMDYYFTSWHQIYHKFITYSVILLILCLYFMGIVIVINNRMFFKYYLLTEDNDIIQKYNSLIETMTSSVLSIVIITIFNLFKYKVCWLLTEFENPRTQLSFESQYTFKIIILSFGNVFFPTIYLAFFKGHFYTHPGEEMHWTFTGIFKADVCKIGSCLVDLSVQLALLMTLKNIQRLLVEFMVPLVNVYYNYLKIRKRNIPVGKQWEEDFVLVEAERFHLYDEYIELVIQYGFMTFFLVSLPIAPIIALINTIVELRVDAIKLLTKYRRIVMRKTAGIGEWNEIIKVITFFGTISNPLLIAYSSTLISRYIYLYNNNFSMKGFINTTLSEFDMKDFPKNISNNEQSDNATCYYLGKRNPPSHPEKYQLADDYWLHLALKSIFFIVLENICLLTSLLLKRLIPAVPRKVRLKKEYDERILQEERMRSAGIRV